jgi:hypothetical protein
VRPDCYIQATGALPAETREEKINGHDETPGLGSAPPEVAGEAKPRVRSREKSFEY